MADPSLKRSVEESIKAKVVETTNTALEDQVGNLSISEADVEVTLSAQSSVVRRRLTGDGVEARVLINTPSAVAEPETFANAIQPVVTSSSVEATLSSEIIAAVQAVPNIASATTGTIGVSGLTVTTPTPLPTPAPTPAPTSPHDVIPSGALCSMPALVMVTLAALAAIAGA